MGRVRVGLVGLGAFGERHLAVLANLADVEVTALCSRTPERARELAAKYGLESRVYTDFRDIAADPTVEVMDVCTRDWEHVEPSVAAAAAGKHLFLEKPIAGSVADGKKILEAVQKAGVVFMVGHILRFDERHLWLKERLDAGDIGKLGAMYLKRDVTRRNNYTRRAVSPILGAQVHDIDLALWLSGERPYELYSAKNHTLEREMLDVAVTVLRFPSGMVANIQTVWLVPYGAPRPVDARLEVHGTKGSIHMDGNYQGVVIWNDERAAYPDTSVLDGVPGGSLKAELEYFVDCVQTGRQPARVPTADAWEVFRIACKAMESAERGVPLGL
ncbi:MAG: Gfo/Idh/MocA family protein [Chloroflexota bacterium]